MDVALPDNSPFYRRDCIVTEAYQLTVPGSAAWFSILCRMSMNSSPVMVSCS